MTSTPPDAKPIGATCLIGADRFTFHSEHVGDTFVIDVAMPPPAGSQKPSVLIVLDGNLTFPTAVGLSRGLSVHTGGPPPLCVVGVGYDVSGRGEKMEHHKIRNRDLSPCSDPRFEAMMRRAPPPFTWEDDIQPGGAGRFRAFLLEELLPWLADQFDVDTGDIALAGISLGGLFVLDTLLTEPNAFRRYVAISPSVWWADRRVLEQAKEMPRLQKSVDLYLAVGAEEEAQDANARMVSNLRDLVAVLEQRADPNLRLSYDLIAGESHMTVFGPALGRALHRVYPAEGRHVDWAKLDT